MLTFTTLYACSTSVAFGPKNQLATGICHANERKTKQNKKTRVIQHAYFIPIVGVGKRGAYSLVHGDLPRQHPFGTTLRFTGPVPADSRR